GPREPEPTGSPPSGAPPPTAPPAGDPTDTTHGPGSRGSRGEGHAGGRGDVAMAPDHPAAGYERLLAVRV
ncbi:MAG: hypothetical protein V5A85_12800, partial [Haloarculaceae archaeon]